jgi:hypothetical protein
MSTLWLAFIVYILGVALILYIRPQTMFRAGTGSWREFGLSNTGSVTSFPFWMFTIVWALVSYALATLGTMFFAATALKSMETYNTTNFIPASVMPAPPAAAPALATPALATPALATPALATPPASPSLPGYYILEQTNTAAPKYIYFGTTPPSIANLTANTR